MLASATDGVGTKIQYARALARHDTIGIDLVAMVVNDLVTCGAEPLFFLDYISTGKVVPEHIKEIVSGVANGCRQAGCALLGGETAEHPKIMAEDDYDLAGFAVGVVERAGIIDGSRLAAGDIAIGLPSSGIHSNGYSLARAVISADDVEALVRKLPGTDLTWGEALLTPTKIYVQEIRSLLQEMELKAAAHITGGGLPENIERLLPGTLDALIDTSAWPVPPIMPELQRLGGISDEEMFHAFNMGLGMVVFVEAAAATQAISILQGAGEQAVIVGKVADGEGKLRLG